jgi:enamine deaminase RidA (YjgF/YER057c/UK114 family)
MFNADELFHVCARLGISLSLPPAPVANYVPYNFDGSILWISGQLPFVDGKISCTGIVGDTVDPTDAAVGAKVASINLLSQLHNFLIQNNRQVKGCLRLGGFIASVPKFTGHSLVMNGASDIIASALAPHGRHARTSIGVASLPLGASVEVEGQFLIA